jgi:hypothetical protein
MFAYWFADHDITKPDHSIIGFRWHAASNANQQAESELRKRGSHLGDDRSRRVVAWLMQSRDDNIMTSDATKGIDIVIGPRL